MMPPPDGFHQDVAGNVFFILRTFLRNQPIGKVCIAPYAVELDNFNAFEPDVFYVSNDRRDGFYKRGFKGAPDLVVEVLSPGTARIDKNAKRRIYTAAGVTELWLIDPDAQEIQVYYLQEDSNHPHATHREKAQFTSPLFPGLTFDCAEIFAN